MMKKINYLAIFLISVSSILLGFNVYNSVKISQVKVTKINLPTIKFQSKKIDKKIISNKTIVKKYKKQKSKTVSTIKFQIVSKKISFTKELMKNTSKAFTQNKIKLKTKNIHQINIKDIDLENNIKLSLVANINYREMIDNLGAHFDVIKEQDKHQMNKKILIAQNKVIEEKKPKIIKDMQLKNTSILARKNVKEEKDEQLEFNKLNIQNKDEIKTILSANEKGEDEMVFFDYSTKSPIKDEQSKIVKKPIVIVDKIKEIKTKITTINNKVAINSNKPDHLNLKKNENNKSFNSQNLIAQNDYSKNDYSKNNYPDDKNISVIKSAHTTNKSLVNSTLEVNIERIVINKNVREKIKNFEITYLDNYKSIDRDFGSGKITLSKKIKNLSIREVLIKDYSLQNYSTRTELVFEEDRVAVNIPVINKDSIYKIFNNREYFDAHVLVELDKDTENVEIDGGKGRNYFNKVYLDEGLNIVNPKDSEYGYILFVGVVPGNRVLSYKLANDKYTSKIFFIDEDEVYFDSNFYIYEKNESFEIWKKDILGAIEYQTDLLSNDVEFMLNEQKAKKESLYEYSFNGLLYPLSSRKYFVIKSEKDKIFVGKNSQKKIIIPSEQFISEIMKRFGVNSLKGQCIVQLNFSKPVKKITYDGLIHKYNISLESYYIDKNGQGFDTVDVETKHAFLKGEVADKNGVIAISIEYYDSSEEYLKTYCSEDTYLVEQL